MIAPPDSGRGDADQQVRVGGTLNTADPEADLRVICVYCTVNDLLPGRLAKARASCSDTKNVAFCVGQVLMGIPSGRFLRAAQPPLGHLFLGASYQAAPHKRTSGWRRYRRRFNTDPLTPVES